MGSNAGLAQNSIPYQQEDLYKKDQGLNYEDEEAINIAMLSGEDH